MHKLRSILFIFMLFFLTTQYNYATEYKYIGKMGYLVDGLNDAKYKDARLAFDLWVKDLAAGDGVETKIHYYENVETMVEDYKNFRFECMVVNPYFLLKYKEVFYNNTKDFWIIKKNEEKFQKYYILVRSDAKIKNIKDLKEKTCIRRGDDYIGRLTLNHETLKAVHTLAKYHLSSIKMTKKFSTAILKTYFGKVDACIVPSYALDIVGEMNPDILKKLVVLYESENIFFPVIGGFHNKTNDEITRRFRVNAARLDETVRGQNILNLFKMKQVIPLKKKDLDPMLGYYKEYLMMKDKYGIKDEE